MKPRVNPLGDLGDELIGEVRELIRIELAMARAELRQQVRAAIGAAIALAVAGVAALIGGLLLVLAAADGIAYALAWPAWAGLLIVAVVLALVAAVAWGVGRGRLAGIQVVPEETVASFGETLTWLKGLPDRLAHRPPTA
ncbi:MAG: phage holin family protein [Vicinamibacterales bacterium]